MRLNTQIRRPPARAAIAALLLLFMLLPVGPARAAPELGEETIDRPVAHTVYWCPIELYVTVSFIADGPEATVEITGRIKNGQSQTLNNRIDNVCLVTKAVHDANLVTIVNDPDAFCTQFSPEAFNFPAVNQQDLIFIDQFQAGLDPGWDTSDWAYYVSNATASASAPNNIANPEPAPTGGSLGLGKATDPDSLSTTGITIDGLTAGVEYVVSFWWKCNAAEPMQGVPPIPELWVKIYGTEFWHPNLDGDLTDNFGPNGVGWGDCDQDADQDFYVSDLNMPNQLFLNRNLFVETTTPPFDDVGSGQGVAWADADNDGHLDLYLSKSGQANHLFRGIGGCTFVDATSGPLGDSGLGRSVAWGDYDRDGKVDLYLCNFGPNRLLKNMGNLTFMSVASDLLSGDENTSSAVWGDFDGDKDPDLYVGNYGRPNKLFRNDGGGSFVDVTSGFLADSHNTTGVAWGDVDGDGDLDLFIANDMGPCRLLRNDGGGIFTDKTPADLLVSRPVFGIVWLDGDNDGDLDLYLNLANQPNRYYRNDGGFGFVRLVTEMDDPGNGRGLATADYDRDGDVDVYVCNLGGQGKLYRNDYPYTGNWLEVRLIGTVSNRAAIGARIQVTATGPGVPRDGLVQIREVSGGSGYLSQSSLVAHFGLSSATQVSLIQISWPSGIVQNLGPVGVNQIITVTETATAAVGPGPVPPTVWISPNPFHASTRISYRLENAAPVGVDIFDLKGSLVRRLDVAFRSAGVHELIWDGTDTGGRSVAAGAYFVRIEAAGLEQARRMIVVR
jgi:enediyne biosynthesis protein E4